MDMKNTKTDWKLTKVSPEISIRDAIVQLESTSLKLLLVVSDEELLIGTISDGDIRRGILRGFDISDSISRIIQRNPIAVNYQTPLLEIKKIMQNNKIQQLPLLNDLGKVVGVQYWDKIEFQANRENLIVIMAGGLGKRLLPLTASTPKPMLSVLGKPILEHIILRAKSEGFNNFFISINHLGNSIKDYFGDGQKFGVSIGYLNEDIPLGTAGALSLLGNLPQHPLVVINGDVLSEVSFVSLIEYHNQHEAVATMAVQMHNWQNPFGVVQTRGIKIVEYTEKPLIKSLVNAGIYVLQPEVISCLESGSKIDMPEVFQRLISSNQKTIAFPIHENWMDIGRPEDYFRANQPPSSFMGN